MKQSSYHRGQIIRWTEDTVVELGPYVPVAQLDVATIDAHAVAIVVSVHNLYRTVDYATVITEKGFIVHTHTKHIEHL